MENLARTKIQIPNNNRETLRNLYLLLLVGFQNLQGQILNLLFYLRLIDLLKPPNASSSLIITEPNMLQIRKYVKGKRKEVQLALTSLLEVDQPHENGDMPIVGMPSARKHKV